MSGCSIGGNPVERKAEKAAIAGSANAALVLVSADVRFALICKHRVNLALAEATAGTRQRSLVFGVPAIRLRSLARSPPSAVHIHLN